MSEDTAIVRADQAAIQVADDALTAKGVMDQVRLIQEVMKEAMKDGEHYGKIPGCGDKPTLLKPGAEKLVLTFQFNPEYSITRIDHKNGHREYEVQCRLMSNNGQFRGAGVGTCSTLESKYRYRSSFEITDDPVPSAYWDLRKDDPKGAQALIGGPGHGVKKNDAGQWVITVKGEKVEHDNPADYYNTVLKIAKKRALVDATLTKTAASDIFTQDIEDLPSGESESTPATQSPGPSKGIQKLRATLFPGLDHWPPKQYKDGNAGKYDINIPNWTGKFNQKKDGSPSGAPGFLKGMATEYGYDTDEKRHGLFKALYKAFEVEGPVHTDEMTSGQGAFLTNCLQHPNFLRIDVGQWPPFMRPPESTQEPQVEPGDTSAPVPQSSPNEHSVEDAEPRSVPQTDEDLADMDLEEDEDFFND